MSDARPDSRYIHRTSNHQKAQTVCKARGIKLDNYDIGDLPPFDTWMRRFDQTSCSAGMYAADLRVQYFTKIKARMTTPSDTIDQMIADNEWWYNKFADCLHTLATGEQPARRVLH